MTPTSNSRARFLVSVVTLLGLIPLRAQQPFSGAPSLEQRLHRLNELGTVLMIAAHPDDERTAVLAYFARGRYMRTAYLSLTRGEGGQNLIGSEQGAALGIIRTQELLDAREIDGAEQFFTRAIDFGFTKTAAETMQKWGHDRILSDVVWVVRRYRPDVVILCFSGTSRDGHGQHQASAILGREGVEAAGDPGKFPEQLQYVQPWRVKRLVSASWAGGARGPGGQAPQRAGEADTGGFNPVLGYSYDELAVLSRSMHHSQGTGAMRRPGPSTTSFELLSGPPASKDLFEGIDTTWNRMAGGAGVGPILEAAIRDFDPAHPARIIPQLVKARPLIAAIDDPLAKIKLAELDEATAALAGLFVEAQAPQPDVSPGGDLAVNLTVLNRSTADVTFEAARFEGFWNEAAPQEAKKLGYNQSVTVSFTRPVPAGQPYSQPYWLEKPPVGDCYTVEDPRLIGLPDPPPPLRAVVRLTIAGSPVELVRPVRNRYADRALGERVRPLAIVPSVAVNMPNSVELFPSGAPRKIMVALRANRGNAAGEVKLSLPAGWKAEPASQPFRIAVSGEQEEVGFTVTPPGGETVARMRAVASVAGREIASGMDVIAYPHIPTQTLFPPAEAKLVRSDIQVTARKVGYIMGAGDEMPDALRQLGLDVMLLSQSDLETGELSRFDAIVAGVRAYNVRPDLRANQPRLMEYVRNGGTYVVQYQGGEGGGPGRGQPQPPPGFQAPPPDAQPRSGIGPYPITIPAGNGYRVTVEEAPVAFPHPDSPLLQRPNRITAKDFEGWIQERGLNFATQWDPRYETVLSSHDPGERPLEGGQLWTRYGKGVYIFTAYSWFRELPAGVPGAYRLFANLLSAKY
jgi:LmbE family N-acetylglucosaminyl deacetylase